MEVTTHNWTLEGKPDGGVAYGTGFCISWQRGLIVEGGRNGAFLTEVLDACLTELKSKDKFSTCLENTEAIKSLEDCLQALQSRLDRRYKEGILGTHIKD